ncbi:hypothetical protein QJQ45_005233 [Haematococcus lacustris]|nr:hypothetical protein QJQ45_005233 [Haematococcus lacustris]
MDPLWAHPSTCCDYGPKVGVPAGPSPLMANLLWDLPAVAAEPSGTTSHKADYQQRSAVAVVKAKGPGSSLATIQGPFEGVSLYKESFGQQLYARREPVLHSGGGGVLPDAARFDAVSLYSQTYLAVGADQRREQVGWGKEQVQRGTGGKEQRGTGGKVQRGTGGKVQRGTGGKEQVQRGTGLKAGAHLNLNLNLNPEP